MDFITLLLIYYRHNYYYKYIIIIINKLTKIKHFISIKSLNTNKATR